MSLFVILLLVIVLLLLSGIHIAQEYERAIVFRLGRVTGLLRMQMLSEIGIDNNPTTVVLVPSEFTNAAKRFTQMVGQQKNN